MHHARIAHDRSHRSSRAKTVKIACGSDQAARTIGPMSGSSAEDTLLVARCLLVGAAGVGAVAIVELWLQSGPTPLAAVALLATTLIAGVLGGRWAAVPAAIVGCYIFGDHHLADTRGVLGTPGVAVTFLFVQGLAVVAAIAGHAVWTARLAPAGDPAPHGPSEPRPPGPSRNHPR
jgi:hypothetical protein